jgi:hypothetical protein
LELPGFVAADDVAPEENAPTEARPVGRVDRIEDDQPVRRRVKLADSVLLVDERPFFPRIIERQGEPLDELKRLGFNAVWLSDPPDEATLREAKATGMWLIAPPPESLPASFGAAYEMTLAWDLGRSLSRRELEGAAQFARRLRQADRQAARPLVCHADAELGAYSRVVDVLTARRDVLGTSLELTDYAEWLWRRSRLARPGTPMWTAIDAQLAPNVLAQIEAVSGQTGPLSFDGEQIRLLAQTAAAAGSRGLLFVSHNSLLADDDDTRRRALALQAINHEMALVEPWLAEGVRLATAADPKRQVVAPVLHCRKGRLAFCQRMIVGGQFVTSADRSGDVSLVIPGVPETDQAFQLTPVGMESIPRRRVAGGTEATFSNFLARSLVVTTSDAGLSGSMNRRLGAERTDAARRELQLARYSIEQARDVLGQLPRIPPGDPAQGEGNVSVWMQQAERQLADAERELGRGWAPAAYHAARSAEASLSRVRRAAWQEAIRQAPSPGASPFAGCFATLPLHWRYIARAPRRPTANLLVGGDCEQLDAMVAAGWRHFQHSQENVRASVELSQTAPAAGRSSLRLVAEAVDPKRLPEIVESPPVWVVSAAPRVRQGTWLRIAGRLRISEPIVGSVDGLTIIDSIGGPPLALRIGQAPQWQEFEMFRIAVDGAPVQVTFALTGLGEAWIDSVAIEPLETTAAASRVSPAADATRRR